MMPDAAARFVWKLARRHTWGSPIPERQLVRLVATTEDHDILERVLEDEVLPLSFIEISTDGVYIPNNRVAHREAADWLRAHTEIEPLTIKATMSRLSDDWPDDEPDS